MASSIYEKGLNKGRVEGQLRTLALLIRGRLGDQGAPLADRLADATEDVRAEVTRLLGTERSDTELVAALQAILPPALEE